MATETGVMTVEFSNYLTSVVFNGGAVEKDWYLALYEYIGADPKPPTPATTLTAATAWSGGMYKEITDYVGTRPKWDSKVNSGKVEFDFSPIPAGEERIIHGACLVSSAAKGSTTGVLALAWVDTTRTVVNNTMKVSRTVSPTFGAC